MKQAFPGPYKYHNINLDDRVGMHPGMTLREYYAGLAMQGLITQGPYDCTVEDLAADSTAHADALIAALEAEYE